jgi:hypothetical protein
MQHFTSIYANYLTTALLLCGFVALLLYHSLVVIYRLVFHPLSGFPGPRLARMTTFYKTYYEVVKGGELLRRTRELHGIYGEQD